MWAWQGEQQQRNEELCDRLEEALSTIEAMRIEQMEMRSNHSSERRRGWESLAGSAADSIGDGTASHYSGAGVEPYTKNTLCTFDVPLADGIGALAEAKEAIRVGVADAAGIPLSSIKSVESLGVLKVREGKKTHSWKLEFESNSVAFTTLKAKKSIRSKAKIRINEDLTQHERILRKSRFSVFQHILQKQTMWVQWRLAEIWVNDTVELDGEPDKDGRRLMTNSGRWWRLREADYKVLEAEMREALDSNKEAQPTVDMEGASGLAA